jgi:hypothetical protein
LIVNKTEEHFQVLLQPILTELSDAPLIDEAIRVLRYKLDGHEARRSEDVRLARCINNHNNKFVRILTSYPCMKAVASVLDMLRLEAVVYSCTHIRGNFNLESASSYKLWEDRVTAIRIPDLPIFRRSRASRKRRRDDDGGNNKDKDMRVTNRLRSVSSLPTKDSLRSNW